MSFDPLNNPINDYARKRITANWKGHGVAAWVTYYNNGTHRAVILNGDLTREQAQARVHYAGAKPGQHPDPEHIAPHVDLAIEDHDLELIKYDEPVYLDPREFSDRYKPYWGGTVIAPQYLWPARRTSAE